MGARGVVETLVITVAAFVTSAIVFALFNLLYAGIDPFELFYNIYAGAFGSSFAIQNTLSKAAPLLLTALCTALPARLGLVVIGADGALIAGGLAATAVGLVMQAVFPALAVQVTMAIVGMLAGGLLIAGIGALTHYRGVNATISSLLVFYIVKNVFDFLVESDAMMKDPASANKPSTYPLIPAVHIGRIFGMEMHWGLVFGVIFCVLVWVLMDHTTFGFAARMAGGNVRAARLSGLPVGSLIMITCFLGGAAAGLQGMVDVAAVHHQANASLYVAQYGFTGILVSFIARHHPLAIIPVAVMFGGLEASGSVLQHRLELPDASIRVFTGIIFVTILAFETFYGRFRLPQAKSTPTPKAVAA
jgi:simple sugar transport system permease protein